MLRMCQEQPDNKPGCGRVYDDVHRSTICPHDPIGLVGAYCQRHDLIHCPCRERPIPPVITPEDTCLS